MTGRGQAGRTDPLAERVAERMCRIAAREPLDGCGALAARHLALTGNRLRARLAVDAARALGASDEVALGWATCCELLAEAMLVHDDLQDGDLFRSGQPTVWARSGAAQAINVGDFLFLLAMSAVDDIPAPDDVRWRLARALARHGGRAVRAQALEMAHAHGRRLGWEDWEQQAMGKSGVRFTLPVHGAVLLCGGSTDEARRRAEPFARLGLIHQLHHDITDLYGHEGRRHGAGVRDGKVTALVAQHLEAWPDDAAWLGRVLRADPGALDEQTLREMGARFRECGTLALLVQRALDIAKDTRCEEGPLRPLFVAMLGRLVEPLRAIEADLASEQGVA